MNNPSCISIDWSPFCDYIKSARRILLTAHVRPDGDSIGSEMSMYETLTSLGKEVRIVNDHQTPPGLQFLDPDGVIRKLSELTPSEKEWIDSIDTFIVLDTCSWMQLGDMAPLFRDTKAKKIVIDHHAIGNDLGAEMFSDSTAEATGTLCFSAVQALGVPITKKIADPLFVAIATDTGWFRFSSVKSSTFRAAAALVEYGANPDELYRFLNERESIARMRLIGLTLQRIEQYEGGAIMYTWITLDDFDRLGALYGDSEDIVNMTLQVADSKVAVILVGQKSGGIKASFRSRCDVDCSLVAASFQGGGHQRAAGATLFHPLEEVKKLVLDATIKAYRESQNSD